MKSSFEIKLSSFLSSIVNKSKSIESSKISIESIIVTRSFDSSDLLLSTELSSKSRISEHEVEIESLSYDRTQAKYYE